MRTVIFIIGFIFILSGNSFAITIGLLFCFYGIIDKSKNQKKHDYTDKEKQNNVEKEMHIIKNIGELKNNSNIYDNESLSKKKEEFLWYYNQKINSILAIENKAIIIEELDKYIKELKEISDNDFLQFRDEMILDITKIIQDFDNFYFNFMHSINDYTMQVKYDDELVNLFLKRTSEFDCGSTNQSNTGATEFVGADNLYDDIVDFVVKSQKASASLLQRKFKIGYNKAAAMIDLLEKDGIIGPSYGNSKPREVLVQYSEKGDNNEQK